MLTALLGPTLSPSPAAGQQAKTCGWDFIDRRETPPTIMKLVARAHALTDRHRTAIEELQSWYRDCDHTAARRAAMSLRNERRRTNSTDPFLRGLLGMVLVRGPDIHVSHGEGALLRPINRHTNAEIEGIRLLAPLVEETGWPEVVQELAAVAVATGKSESLETAAAALRAAPDSMHDDALWTALAEVELGRGNLAEAREAALLAGSSPRAARALGITRMLADADPVAGAKAYLAGLDIAEGTPALQLFFDDIRLLLSDEERSEWNALEDGRAAWIRRKWEWRSMLAGIRVGERLAEHQRRLAHVLRNYRRTSYRGAAVPIALWTDSAAPRVQLIDDRGVIYLRHGPPIDELTNSLSDRIAWVYSRPGPIQPVYEFDLGPDRSDYFLAEPYPFCEGVHMRNQRIAGMDTVPGTEGQRYMVMYSRRNDGYPPEPDMGDWATRIHRYDPALGTHYLRCARGTRDAELSYDHALNEAQRRGAEVLNSENAAPRLQHPLTAAMNLYSFATMDATELVAYLAVHAGELSPASASIPASYAFRIHFAAGNPATESITRTDTLLAFTHATVLPQDAVVGTAIPLRISPADRTRVTMTILNPYQSQQGQVLATTRTVPAFDRNALGLSDIVIGEPRDGTWKRGEYRLAPAQGHVILEGSPFRLYYEVYNARTSDRLNVRIVVAPAPYESLLDRLTDLVSSRDALVLEFSEDALPDADGVVRSEREVASQLKPGAYVVTVILRDGETGNVARRETNMVVVQD